MSCNGLLFALAAFAVARYIVKYTRVFIYGGRVVKISDIDTIIVRRYWFKRTSVRLAEIDGPEKTQPRGMEAREYLAKMLPLGSLVLLEQYSKNGRYNRLIAHVYKMCGEHVNLQIVLDGYAWCYEQYSKDPRFKLAQKNARESRLGLWQDKNPEAPWDYRKR